MDRDEAARELEVSPSPLDRMVCRGEYLGLGAEHGREQAAHRRARRRVARLGVAVPCWRLLKQPIQSRQSLDVCFAICEHSPVEPELAIQWSPRAIRDMRRIAPPERQRIIARIEQYAADPESLANQVIMLANSRYRRLRVGDHRVIFDVSRGGTPAMAVLRVRHRREAYD